MKLKIVLFLFILGLNTVVLSQSKQEDTTNTYKSLIPIKKQNLLKNIDILANMSFNYRIDFLNGELQKARFTFEQFRLEIKGYVTKKIYFRFRHRYTSDFKPTSIDKIIKGVDMAYLRFDVGKRWQLSIGKMFADWGGYEFDANPIDIYQYTDINEYTDLFLSGIGAYVQLTKNHGLSFQLLNTRTATFVELYDTIPDIQESKAPLGGVINWRGSFWGGKIRTLWSYSLFAEAKGYFKNYIALIQ